MHDFEHLDPYAVLGVAPDATPDQIEAAFQREIAKYRPDRFRTSDPATQEYARRRAQRIAEAYAALGGVTGRQAGWEEAPEGAAPGSRQATRGRDRASVRRNVAKIVAVLLLILLGACLILYWLPGPRRPARERGASAAKSASSPAAVPAVAPSAPAANSSDAAVAAASEAPALTAPSRPVSPPAEPAKAPVASPPATPEASPIPIEDLERGTVLATYDFAQAQGWPAIRETDYSLGPRDGRYAISSEPNSAAIFAYGSPLPQDDVVIGADVLPVHGWAGLNFGPQNSFRFYVSGDGYYRVDRDALPLVDATPSHAVHQGANRLSIVVSGRRATLYANGTLLATVELPKSLAGTTYGFVVRADERGGDGEFDNLTVRSLPR